LNERDEKGKIMRLHARRNHVRTGWVRGTRKRSRRIRPRYRDDDVRIFLRLSQNSFRVAGNYIKKLIASA
jgi:hypothetical protein